MGSICQDGYQYINANIRGYQKAVYTAYFNSLQTIIRVQHSAVQYEVSEALSLATK